MSDSAGNNTRNAKPAMGVDTPHLCQDSKEAFEIEDIDGIGFKVANIDVPAALLFVGMRMYWILPLET